MIAPSFKKVEIVISPNMKNKVIKKLNKNFGSSIKRGYMNELSIVYHEGTKMKDIKNEYIIIKYADPITSKTN